jgi:hypothetical protein
MSLRRWRILNLFFKWNHDPMMRQGAEAGVRLLFARRVSLVEVDRN